MVRKHMGATPNAQNQIHTCPIYPHPLVPVSSLILGHHHPSEICSTGIPPIFPLLIPHIKASFVTRISTFAASRQTQKKNTELL